MNECLYCGKLVKNKYCNVSCQNKHQGPQRVNIKYGIVKTFRVNCEKCGKEFDVKEREKLFPQKEKYYCNVGCANSRERTDETKKKIKDSINFYNKNNKKDKVLEYVEKKCPVCGKIFLTLKKDKKKICSEICLKLIYKKAGLKSVESQNRRSKNEICFAELCEKNFKNIGLNEQMFNGWDADVILKDQKLAILWNGNWHHKKISREHSLEQVQNRDRIKIKEILKLGYTPYIINDYGKYNKEFVENEYEKLKEKYCPIV